MSIKRLNKLYENALEVAFDNKSKLVFISDVHRGDGTYYDDLLSNRNIYMTALNYYYRNAFTYIELGDGDELWKNRNCRNISFNYEDAFRVLNKFKKNKRLYMVYGNHDMEKKYKRFYKEQVRIIRRNNISHSKEFIDFITDLEFYEGIKFNYTPLNEYFLATHGHQVDIMNSDLWKISRFLVRYVWKFLYGVAGFREPTSPANSHTKRSSIDWKIQKWARDEGKMIVCGHTHNPRLPNRYEPPYINDGACVMPYTMTAIEVERGQIVLVKWIIDSEENGVLKVIRKIIGGPEEIESYLIWARDRRKRLINS